jgi:chromosome segregation ATPase
MKKTIVTALLCSIVTAGAGANFEEKDFKICTPHKIIVDDLVTEIEDLKDQDLIGQIENLKFEKREKENEISAIASSARNARHRAESLEDRLHLLSTQMGKLKADEKRKIAQGKAEIEQGKKDKIHNQRKKDKCKGGLLGTFCRKKYRSRIKDAEKKISRGQQKITTAQNAIVNLPKEKAALPAKIAKANAEVSSLQSQLTQARTAKPTVVQLRGKIERLVEQNANLHMEIDNLEGELSMAQGTLGQCQKMTKLAKAYKVLKKKAQEFKAEPVLCDNVDMMLDMADKAFQKKGIRDAHQIVCEESEVPADDFQVAVQ